MKSKLILLDIQHINKPNNTKDRGARPKKEITDIPPLLDNIYTFCQNEVDYVFQYMNYLRNFLELDGHRVIMGFAGSYSQRHAYINEVFPRADLYIAGHLNAGGGRYARVEIDKRAGHQTKLIAELVRKEFEQHLPVTRCDIVKLSPSTRGFSCIGRVRCSALLLEPLFLDYAKHYDFLQEAGGLKQIAWSISKAIKIWSK